MKKFPSRESGRLAARTLERLQLRRATLFVTLFAVLISTFTFVNQSPVRAATVGSGACVQTVDSNVGVSVTQVGNECIVTFVSGTNNNWTVPARITSVRALIVGGGGGGGAWVGGGGGGGGFRDVSSVSVTPGNTVAVTVGAGGAPANVSGGASNLPNAGYSNAGVNGGNSSFGSYVANGGGKGGSHDPNGGANFEALKPLAGGSGGGGTGRGSYSADSNYGPLSTGASGNTPSTSPSQGNTGGNGYAGGTWVAGGGGGAGGVGSDGTANTGGAGGAGSSSNISGSAVLYAGGGGGVAYASAGFGSGGSGGGGNGGRTDVNSGTGVSGTANTGGGGGGGTASVNTSTGGSGGSGIVIVRYTIVEAAGSGSCQQFFSKSGTGSVTVAEANNFCYLAFRNTGAVGTQTSFTLRKPSLATNFDYLVVGGGGGGALRHGGGGGAGGLLKGSLDVSSLSELSLKVGNGGSGATTVTSSPNNYGPGLTGQDSSLQTVVAKGGGGGNTGGSSGQVGLTGGSGGGALAVNAGGAATSGQGFAGAGGVGGVSPYPSGGGGGAGGAGTAGSGTTAGAGGAGAIWDASFTKTIAQNLGWSSTSAQYSGDQVFFAGGGGGGVASGTAGTASAGGGAGSGTTAGAAGLADSGGGGGGSGCCNDGAGGNGGSGVVIIRYALATQSAFSISSTSAFLGTTLPLTTSGGSGSGAVSYAVTSAGTASCSVSGSTLSYTSTGTCTVTATKASADGYAAISSSATTITISAYAITYAAGTGATGSNQVVNKSHGTNITLAKGEVANSWFTKSGNYVIGWSTSNGGSLTHQLGASYTTNAALTLYPVWSANYYANLTSAVPGSAGTSGITYRVNSTLVPNKSSFTIEGWFFDKPTATGQNPIYSQGKTNNNSFTVMTNGSTDSRSFLANFTGQVVTVTGVTRGTWHHFAVTRQGLNYVIYIDGIQQASGTVSSDSYVDDATTYSFFGENAYYMSPGKHVFHGYLDQIKIWNGPLTSSQVSTSMHGYGASGISSPSLTNLYDFNDQSATTAKDQVGSIDLTAHGTGTLAFSEFTFANTFDSNGGDAVASSTFHNHKLITEPTAPTKANHSFNGWTTTLNDASTLVTFPYAPWPFAAETLYANWTATNVTATFKSNYVGGASDTTQLIPVSTATALTTNSFTRAGYTFAGWATNADGTGASYTNGQSVNLTTGLTLYAKWTASQTVDSSLELAGTVGQYAQISDGQIIPASGAFTIQAWLKAPTDTSANGTGMVFSQGLLSGNSFYLYRNSAGTLVYFRGGAASTALCGTAPADSWQHVTITYNGSGTSTCYLNGVSQSTLSANANVTTKFVVGAQSIALLDRGTHWKGSIDEVRVYNTARTATQIAADAHAYATVTDSSLVAYYDFNEGAGTTGFNQKSGASSATNLTLSGTPTFADVAETSNVNGRTVIAFKRSYLNNTGGWSTPAGLASANALVVGGGGGGAGSLTTRTMDGTGGGGGGGAYLASGYPVSGVIPIVVGFGGLGGTQGSTSNGREGNRGGTSSFGSVSAGGGGGGGCSSSSGNSSVGNLIPCAAGTVQHGGSGTAGGGGGGATNFLLAYNFGSGGTGSDATVGSVTFAGQAGFRGGYFNDGGTSSTGDGSPGGGSRVAANRNTVGAGFSSSITGTSIEYGRGGTARGVTGYTYSTQATGFGTGGSGSYSAAGPATNGGTGAGGVVVLSYGLENQAALTVTSIAGTTGSTLALTTSGGSGSGTVTFTASTGTAGCSVSGSTLSFTSTGTCEVTATKAAADGFSAVSSSATTITITAGTYTVTYNYNNATGGNSRATADFTLGGTALTLPTPTRTGYAFNGWFEASNLSGSALGSTYSPTQSRTIYAKWTGNTYTITYNYDNATGGNSTATADFTVGGSALTLPTPTRTGLLFSGWYSDANKSAFVGREGASYSPAGTGTLYAKWTNLLINLDAADTSSYPGTGSTWTSVLPGAAADAGTLTGNTTFVNTNGIKALRFDGNGDYVLFPQTTAKFTGPMTFETWINPSALPSNNNDFSKIATRWFKSDFSNSPATAEFHFALRKSGSTVKLNLFTTGADNQFGSHDFAVSGINKWYHVGFSIDANNMAQLYVNGQPDGDAFSAPRTVNNDAVLFLGEFGSYGLAGQMSKVKVHNTGLSAASMLSNYNTDANSYGNYTIEFNANDGSGSPATVSQVVVGGTATALRANTFTRTGYTFAGWTENSDGTGTSYTNSQNATFSANDILYAKWTANAYTVTYNYNNATGGNSVATANFTVGDSALTLPTPTRTGYTFDGWYEASNFSGSALGSTYSPTQSRTIYAKWTGNTYTVTYNYDNATGGNSTATADFTVGGSALTLPTPTRTGYTFAGWHSDSAKTVSVGNAGASYSPASSLTLYAKWTEITYTITYDRNSATGTPERATDTYTYTGGAVTLSTVGSMAKTGYRFDGWQVSGSTTKLSSTYTPSADVTLEARWAAASYAITYFSNSGGTAPSADTYTTGGSAVTLPTQGSMSRTGYTFNGWSTTINDVTTKIANSQSSATLTTSAPVNLFALWTANSYSATYSTQDAGSGAAPTDATVYNIGNTIIVKANTGSLARTGYSFAGWTDNSSGTGTVYKSGDTYTVGSASVSFYPKWTANTYTITYNVNGATGTQAASSTSYTTGNSAVSLSGRGNMTKTGHSFTGWSTSPTGIGQTTATTTEDVTLYAIWELNVIPYSYNRGIANGTTLTGSHVARFPNPSSFNSSYGANVTLANVGSATGDISETATVSGSSFKFFGWNDGNTTYNPGSTYVVPDLVSPATSHVLTAQWVELLAVRYALNGGSGIVDIDEQCVQTGDKCLLNQAITLSAAPTREGYTFAGWRNQADTATNTAGESVTVTNTNYLWYAQWTAIPYTMTFNANGGNATVADQVKNIGQSFTFPSPGTRAGYDFNGWIRSDIMNSPTYGVGTTYVTGSSSLPFVASWTPHTYTVTYNWNGGVGSPTAPADYTVGQTAITLPTGTNTRDGYIFDGWQAAGTTTKLTSPYAPTANTLLEARWLDGAYVITFDAKKNDSVDATSSVTRATSLTLPTPTRAGFSFAGWYQDENHTLIYGQGGASVTPTATRTVYAKWTQNSLVGINPAHLNSLVELTMVSNSASNWTGSHTLSGTAAELNIPANALPAGTKVNVSFVEDLSRPASLIDSNNAYFTSVAVHWLSGSGETATVPDAVSSSPLSLKLTNPAIVAGAKVFKIVNGVVTEVATATVDGEVTITFTQDPEFVVAATRPGSPTAVTATNNQNAQSTISWNAPLGNGGSSVTGYTVTASPGAATCTTTGTSCQITGLTNNTSYTFTVKATNAIGDSLPSSPSSAITPRLAINYNVTFNSNGGSSVGNSSFVENGSLSAPTDPTRSGYNFIGWATTDGNESTIVSFPYSPSNADLTLYAIWRASNPALNPNNSGNNGVVITPISTKPSATPTPKTSASAKPTTKATSSAKPTISETPEATPEPTSSPQDVFANAPKPDNGIDIPKPGESLALIGDRAIETVVTVSEFEKLIEIGDSISISFQATDAAGNQLPTSPDGSVQVVQGATISANGSGFKPGSPVEAWLYSTPILLGTGIANAQGTFDDTYGIKSEVPLGDHTVVLHGVSPEDEVITLALGVTVIADDADTSSNTLLIAVLAFLGALLTFGLWLVLRRRSGTHKK